MANWKPIRKDGRQEISSASIRMSCNWSFDTSMFTIWWIWPWPTRSCEDLRRTMEFGEIYARLTYHISNPSYRQHRPRDFILDTSRNCMLLTVCCIRYLMTNCKNQDVINSLSFGIARVQGITGAIHHPMHGSMSSAMKCCGIMASHFLKNAVKKANPKNYSWNVWYFIPEKVFTLIN